MVERRLPKPKVAGSKPVVRLLLLLAVLAAGCGSSGSGTNDELAFVVSGHGEATHIVAVDADGRRRRELTPPSDPAAGRTAAWSPTDPATILFEGAGGVWLADADSGELRHLASGSSPAWSPNGKQIALYQAGKGIVILSSSGDRQSEIEPPVDPEPLDSPVLAWSPDGTELAVVITLPDPGDELPASRLYRVPVDGREPKLLLESVACCGPPIWHPDGKRIAFVGGGPYEDSQLWMVGLDGGTARVVRRRVSNVAWSSKGELAIATLEANGTSSSVSVGGRRVLSDVNSPGLAWSADGETVAVAALQGAFVFSADGRRLGGFEANAHSPSFSPDGTRVAVLDGFNGARLVVADRTGSNRKELTAPHTDKHPVWSPDGTRIAFERTAVGRPTHVVVAEADGNGERDVGAGSRPVWARNGTAIVAVTHADRGRRSEIWLLDVAGGGGERKIASGENASVSNDGNRIAFVRHTSVEQWGEVYTDSSTLFTINLDGTGLRRVAGTEGTEAAHFYQSRWLPGDRALGVYAQSIGGSQLDRVSLDGSKKFVTALGSEDEFAYSPDGARLAFFQDYPHEELVITGGGEETVRVREPKVPRSFNGPLSWSPDGRMLAFQMYDDETDKDEIFVVNADGSGLKAIAELNRFDGGPAWRPRKGR